MRGGARVLRDLTKATIVVLALLGAVAVLLVGGVIALFCIADVAGPSAEGMQRDIEDDIPVGASLEDIKSWLNDHDDIEYGDELYKADDYSRLRDLGIPPEAPVLSAIVRGNPGVTIDFILDEDFRFQRVVVERYWILP